MKTSKGTTLRQFVVWSTTGKGPHFQLLLQILVAGSGTLATMQGSTIQKPALWLFFLALIIMIVWISLLLVLGRKYALNLLISNPETGVAYDRDTNILNVSLRRRTVFRLFEGILNARAGTETQEILKSIGRDTGIEFASNYRDHLVKVKLNKELKGEELFRELLIYDSSSGMGKFDLEYLSERPPRTARVMVTNPFTMESDKESGPNANQFLVGYVEGMMKSALSLSNLSSTQLQDGDATVVCVELKE